MSEQQPEKGADATAARPSQTIRLSAEELKAIIAQEQASQGNPPTEKKPWED